MDDNGADAKIVRLGVPGLPSLTDSLMAGGLYLLIAETASARYPILATTLAHGLGSEIQCRIVVPQNPEVFVQRLESFDNLSVNHSMKKRLLQMYVMQEEFTKKMFRHGAEAFVEELDHYEFPDGGYVIFDQADDLLSLHDVVLALDQVDVLRKWAKQHQVVMLIVLTRTNESQTSTINALMDSLTGIVRLGANRSGLELTFDYWQSPEGTIAGRSYLLKAAQNGLYEASSNAVAVEGGAGGGFEKPEVVNDSDAQFFYMDPNLGSLAKQMKGKWQRVDTLVGMLHATRNMRMVTCILLFQQGSVLRQLAETVHTLRQSLGRYASIVVQEKDASLRYQNEALLLKLGLNLVINRDVPISRLPLLFGSLKGQVFTRDVDINFEAALGSVLPSRASGYLIAQRYVREVEVVLERSETLDIPSAMVVGRPQPTIPLIDLVTNNGINRPGDLFTTDAENFYVFLSACPQTVLLPTLARLFKMPVDDVFVDVRFIVSREEMQAEMAALLRASEHETMPDFSEIAAAQAQAHAQSRPPAPKEVAPVQEFAPEAPVIEAKPPAPVSAPKQVKTLPEKALPLGNLFKNASADSASILTPDSEPVAKPVKVAASKPSIKPAPAPQVMIPQESSSDSVFEYDGISSIPTIGKKDAPRATRTVRAVH